MLRQLRCVLETAWAEWTGVRRASAGAVRCTVPRQVAGALEGLAAGATREGLEVRVRHAVALQPQRAGKDTGALRATVALARAGLSRRRLALRRAPGLLLQLHRVCVGHPVGVDEQVAAQPRGSGPCRRGWSGRRAFRLRERGSLGGRRVHGLRGGGPRMGWPGRKQQHLERQPVRRPLGSGAAAEVPGGPGFPSRVPAAAGPRLPGVPGRQRRERGRGGRGHRGARGAASLGKGAGRKRASRHERSAAPKPAAPTARVY